MTGIIIIIVSVYPYSTASRNNSRVTERFNKQFCLIVECHCHPIRANQPEEGGRAGTVSCNQVTERLRLQASYTE